MKEFFSSNEISKEETEKYNRELWLQFCFYAEKSLCFYSEVDRNKLSQSFDLFKAIQNFRKYNTVEKLLAQHPELETQIEYINLLWNQFSNMTEENLSDIAIQMIHELSL